MTIKMNNDQAWLEWLAERDDSGVVSAAGWIARAMDQATVPVQRRSARVLGQLVEYARRDRGLSVEMLAQQADVDLAELVAIERDPHVVPEPRTVHQLAHVLGLPAVRLMELAGLAEPSDEKLTQAAIRFAARSEPSSQLSPAEREVLDEFVKVLSAAGK